MIVPLNSDLPLPCTYFVELHVGSFFVGDDTNLPCRVIIPFRSSTERPPSIHVSGTTTKRFSKFPEILFRKRIRLFNLLSVTFFI